MTKPQTTDERLRQAIGYMAEHALEYIVTEGPARLYRCAEPGTNNFSFFVLLGPSAVTVYGDIGNCLVYRPGTGDMIPWLRGSVRSTGYMMGKMRGTNTEFCADMVPRIFQDVIDDLDPHDDSARIADVRAAAADLGTCCSEQDAYQALSDLGVDIDGDEFSQPTTDTIHTIAALQKFIELLDASQDVRPIASPSRSLA